MLVRTDPHSLHKSCAVLSLSLSLSRSLLLRRSGQELCGFVHELRFTAREAKLHHSWMQWKQIRTFFSPLKSFRLFMLAGTGTPLPPHAWHTTPLFFTAYALWHLHSVICSGDCTRLKETCPNCKLYSDPSNGLLTTNVIFFLLFWLHFKSKFSVCKLKALLCKSAVLMELGHR